MIDVRKERLNHAQDRTKDASVATVKKQGAAMKHIKKYWQWYAMMFIPIVYYIVFRYIPMFGNIIAFRRYRAGSSIFGDEWSGLKYFNQFMKDQNFWRAFKNTLLLNFKYLIISFPLTLIFALLLNEVKNVHFKKIVQTISYLPTSSRWSSLRAWSARFCPPAVPSTTSSPSWAARPSPSSPCRVVHDDLCYHGRMAGPRLGHHPLLGCHVRHQHRTVRGC